MHEKGLRRKRSKVITFFLDLIFIIAAFFLATLIAYPLSFRNAFDPIWTFFARLAVCVAPLMLTLFLFGCFSGIWKYAGRIELMRVAGAYIVIIVPLICIFFFNPVRELFFPIRPSEELIPPVLSDGSANFILMFGFIGFAFSAILRFSYWFYRYFRHLGKNIAPEGTVEKRAIIIGAGYTGAFLITRFINNPGFGYTPVAIVDDNPDKHGMTLSGVKVIGGKEMLNSAVSQYKADVIIIAISKILKADLKALYEKCLECKVSVKIAPVMTDNNGLENEPVKLENIKIEQLLGRDEITVRQELVDSCVKGKVILITGGAGSIGSELCRQALYFGCEHLIIFDAYENGLFELDNELAKKFDRSHYTLVVGNVRDKRKLESVFGSFRPQVVFHAAAYKHVPMMEINCVEAVKTNIFGTLNLINQCNESGVEKFIFISTDKAVNPANIMGATKRVAEMMVQAHGKISAVKMAAVRFGNVVGSNGSAIPIFLKQIKSGGPVTVTHKDIMRYFMTIPEAVSLVLQAGAFASSGEVFVLDMGEPVKIYTLAEDLIRLSGLEPHKDIKIDIIGLRQGEKLFEELRFDNETCDKTTHDGIFITRLANVENKVLVAGLRELQHGVNIEDDAAAARALFKIVPSEYRA